MKHRNMLHRQIRTGQRWRRRYFPEYANIDWYENFARRWQQLERLAIPIIQKMLKETGWLP